MGEKFNKEVQSLNFKNHKALLKEIQDLNNGKISYIHRPTDNLSKMAILLKLIYKFNTSPGNIQGGFLQNWQSNHKIRVELQGIKNSQTILEKNNKVWGHNSSSCKVYNKAAIIKILKYLHWHINQWNRTEVKKY